MCMCFGHSVAPKPIDDDSSVVMILTGGGCDIMEFRETVCSQEEQPLLVTTKPAACCSLESHDNATQFHGDFDRCRGNGACNHDTGDLSLGDAPKDLATQFQKPPVKRGAVLDCSASSDSSGMESEEDSDSQNWTDDSDYDSDFASCREYREMRKRPLVAVSLLPAKRKKTASRGAKMKGDTRKQRCYLASVSYFRRKRKKRWWRRNTKLRRLAAGGSPLVRANPVLGVRGGTEYIRFVY